MVSRVVASLLDAEKRHQVVDYKHLGETKENLKINGEVYELISHSNILYQSGWKFCEGCNCWDG